MLITATIVTSRLKVKISLNHGVVYVLKKIKKIKHFSVHGVTTKW